ncbi:MAG: hypothetical protein HY912_14560 [Desulfomonile tiedjei]|uniref:Uncharacterized protein n=1 Tax=Desulfomonile tiedjei TaxID=2358 RepID=A0A9D6Z480_9BACT|nr:hypothetical protein [Desulfomonile tiedjei]
MTFSRLIKLIAILGAVSAAALLLASRFFPGFSVLGSYGWLIYLVGGALVFLAFFLRSLSVKSKGIQEVLVNGQHSQESDPDLNLEDVRTRIRAIRRQRSRSGDNDSD